MKQLFNLLFILVGFCTTGYSQKFVSEDNVWVTERTQWLITQPGSIITHIQYKFQDKHEINGTEYYYLYFSEDQGPFQKDMYGVSYREDDSGHVYALSSGIPEQLFYNFNLEVGDIYTLPVFDQDYEVLEVDTISLLDGNEIRRWVYDFPPGAEDYFVLEGIGIVSDPLRPWRFRTSDVEELLHCFYKDGRLVYQNDDNRMCNEILAGTEDKIQSSFSLSVIDNHVRVEGSDLNDIDISIHSVIGQLIEGGLINSDTYRLRSELESGIYYAQLTRTGKVLHAQTLFIP